METYLRLMFLKYRYRLGYETLCAEVTTRCGSTIDVLNAELTESLSRSCPAQVPEEIGTLLP